MVQGRDSQENADCGEFTHDMIIQRNWSNNLPFCVLNGDSGVEIS